MPLRLAASLCLGSSLILSVGPSRALADDLTAPSDSGTGAGTGEPGGAAGTGGAGTPAGQTGGAGTAGTSEADLRHQLEIHSPFFDAGTSVGWTVVPAVDVMGIFTDNILQTHYGRRWDIGTAITPSVAVIGNTPNTQLRLFFAPTLQIYARTPQENSLTQSLQGNATFTVVPDEFFVSAYAFSGVGSTNGFGTAAGLGLGNGAFTPNPAGINAIGVTKDNAQQVYSFSVSPYYVHRFGDIGSVRVGYTAGETLATTFSGFFVPVVAVGNGNNSQHSFNQSENASFSTGEILSRWNNVTVLSANQSYGSGQLSGATSWSATNQTSYAFNQFVSVSGLIGYEESIYPEAQGAAGVNTTGVTWRASTTLTPNPDSQVTFGYGRSYGVSGPYVNANYAVTARTTISANYTATQTTTLQSTQNQVALGEINQYGEYVNRQTGAPLVIGTNNALGIRPGVYNTKTLGAAINTVYDRDTISLTATGQSQQAVSVPTAAFFNDNQPIPTVGSTDTFWTLATYWHHSYTPDLSGTAGVYYTNSSYPGNSPSRSNAFGTILSWQYMFSDKLTGYLAYSFLSRTYSLSSDNVYVDSVVIGLHRSF
jgi:uncharacterized protein (PEP-CTERM system associated)